MTMRDFMNIIEGVEEDLNMEKMANDAYHMLARYVYDDGNHDFEVEFTNSGALSSYLCFKPETLGYDKEFGTTDLLICLGKKRPDTMGLSGMYAKFGGTVLGRYTHAVIVDCLDALNKDKLRAAVGSTRFVPVYEHEFMHYLDVIRTKEKISGKNTASAKNKEQYYNDDSEYNAYYHNVASRILHLINEIRKHQYTAQDAQDVADLYGITSDFAQTLNNCIGTDLSTREFYKWLTDDRRKALLKRLYKAHQVLLGLMETGATPAS